VARLEALAGSKAFHAALDEAVRRANAKLPPVERVRRFLIARAPFSVENEQMTPTLKVRRHMVRKAYGTELEALYQGR
jgi:long-chain acyl-CoA synthetase